MNRKIKIALTLGAILHGIVAGAGFFSPYDPAQSDRLRPYEPPMRLTFFDQTQRFHLRPFFYPRQLQPDGRQFVDRSAPVPIQFLVQGPSYKVFGVFRCRLHLFGSNSEKLFLLGSDGYGRDHLSRILRGGQWSLLAALSGTAITLMLALVLGLCAGYYGGSADLLLMRGSEVIAALPAMYLLLGLRAFLPLATPSAACFSLTVLVLAVLCSGRSARLVRGIVLSVREREFFQAARGFGSGDCHLLWRHVIPFTRSTLLTQAALLVPQFVLMEITLSFLGAGVPDPEPSWGNLLSALQQYSVMNSHWWMGLSTLVMLVFFAWYVRFAQLLAEP